MGQEEPVRRFDDFKQGFARIARDRRWAPKVLLGGFLLINPFLLVLLPALARRPPDSWMESSFPWLLIFNTLTFWFSLGFTFEVLRRARTGNGVQLPEWEWSLLPRYAREGAVKLALACATLIFPVGLWAVLAWLVFVRACGLPLSMFSLFMAPALWLAVPFCAVACCRWLDGASVSGAAFNYAQNWRLFRRGMPDYLTASAFLMGVNALTTAFFYTIPFGVFFGLCLVDTWFGLIYDETVRGGKSSFTAP